MIPLPVIILLMIPVTAAIDYFAFRDRFKKEMGEQMKWHYFIVPCALELGCFVAGYIMGAAS